MRHDYTEVEVKRVEGHLTNKRLCMIRRESWRRIPDTDLCLITLPEAGEVMDYSKFFPEEMYTQDTTVTWVYKNRDCVVDTAVVRVHPQRVIFQGKEIEWRSLDGQGGGR